MSNISLNYAQIIDPLSFKSINLAKIYIGEYGTLPNPAVSGTWKQAYFVNSDGTRTAASQPIRTNAAGYAVDGSGNIKTIQVDGGYSLLVQDQFNATKFSQACSPANDGSVLEFDTIAGFAGALDGSAIFFKGRDTVGDGGGGMFRYSATSTQPADGGIVFAPAGGGRLFREGWTDSGFNGPINPRYYGVKGDGVANDKPTIQAMIDAVSTMGGGEIVFDSDTDYLISDGIYFKSNLVIRHTGKGFLKLTQSSATGGVYNFVGTSAQPVENVTVYNPRVDANNLGYPTSATYGENGIAGSKCRNIKVFGGISKNCRRGASNPIGTGGKAIQFEDGVDDILVDGLTAQDCTVAMETAGLEDVASPYEFRRNTGVLYTNIRAFRCERLISVHQTLSPPSESVAATSAVIDGVVAVDCGREVPAGTELDFGLILNDRASNVKIRNVTVYNSAGYGKVSSVIRQHRGTKCEFDVKFFGECDALVSHDIFTGAGSTGENRDNIFGVSHFGSAAYAANGPSDVLIKENLYIVQTDVLTSGLIGSGLQVPDLYGRFIDGTKGKSIEGPFNTIAAFFANNYATVPTAFAGEVRVNGITLTLTSGAHKVASTNDLILSANGSDRIRANAAGTILYAIPTHADNAAAAAAGLPVGQLYVTSSGQLMIRY